MRSELAGPDAVSTDIHTTIAPVAPPTGLSSTASASTTSGHAAPRRRQPRAVGQQALLPVALVVVISLAPIVGDNPLHGGGRDVLAVLLLLTLLTALTRQFRTAQLGLTLAATIAAFALPSQISWWPLPGVVGVGVYLCTSQIHRPRPDPSDAVELVGATWRGRLARTEIIAITALAALTSTALWLFHELTPPGLQFGAELVNQLPIWSLALAGLGFVTVNAAVEEILFRGIILNHLIAAIDTRRALALQALGFGLLNLHGYPDGLIGVALTTTYGLLLGLLRLKSGGLLAGWIAHLLADSVIFLLILQTAAHTR